MHKLPVNQANLTASQIVVSQYTPVLSSTSPSKQCQHSNHKTHKYAQGTSKGSVCVKYIGKPIGARVVPQFTTKVAKPLTQ
jgi:hypothetical protein